LIIINSTGKKMQAKSDRLEVIRTMIYQKKVVSFASMSRSVLCSAVTLRRDLTTLQTITSYTHRGSYLTLPDIPTFNGHGIWFFRGIGFSRFNSSLELIVSIIENSKYGITQEEIEALLKIGISKQIQILMEQEPLHRVKTGAKYVYIPKEAAKNIKTKLKLLGSRQVEEYYEQEVKFSDLIAVLKVVLQEGKIEMKSLKRWIKKYSLRIPVAKLERIIFKYKLDEKKTP
jgi:hypothetical protein